MSRVDATGTLLWRRSGMWANGALHGHATEETRRDDGSMLVREGEWVGGVLQEAPLPVCDSDDGSAELKASGVDAPDLCNVLTCI